MQYASRSRQSQTVFILAVICLMTVGCNTAQRTPAAIAGDRSTMADFEIQRYVGFPSSHSEPSAFVRRSDHEIDPMITRAALSQDDLPELYAMLRTSTDEERSAKIAQTICMLSDKPDESAEVVLDYLRKPGDWQAAHDAVDGVRSRLAVIEWLGYLGGDDAEAVLLDLLDPEGAAALAEGWGEFPLPPFCHGDLRELAVYIQANAAMGVTITRNPEGLAIVRHQFEQACLYRPFTRGTPEQFNKLMEAVAISQLIDAVGIQQYTITRFHGSIEHATGEYVQPLFDRLHNTHTGVRQHWGI